MSDEELMARTIVRPCERHTPRCIDARDYNVELRECCRGHVVQMMSDLVPLLNESGATWWADYGTLLGAVRNPLTTWADYPWLPQEGRTTPGPHAGIIPHDKDADLGVLESDWSKLKPVWKALQQKGYNIVLKRARTAVKMFLSRRNETNIDLFFWLEREGRMFRRRYASVDRCKGREFPKEWLKGMTSVPWEGLTLPAPADPERFLAHRYGPNWMVPVAANHDGIER